MPRSATRAVAIVVATMFAVGSADARADDAQPFPLVFNAFGTIGATYSSERGADFVTAAYKSTGAGYSRPWSASVDSLVGGQVSVEITPSWSAVVQVIAEQNHDDRYVPHVEWANLKYQFTPDFSVRVGRIALPTFLLTESRKVGYAIPWARPPIEVYGLVPITNNDGVDATYRLSIGSAVNTLQLTAGRSQLEFPANGSVAATVKARKTATLAETFETGFATLHFSAGRTTVTIPQFAPLFDGFRQFGPMGAAIADRYDVHDRRTTFVGVGGSYDPGDWFAMAEWGEINSRSIVGRNTGWYLSGGYRIDRFTPYATYATMRGHATTSDPGLAVGSLPPGAAASAAALNAALDASLLAQAKTQSTVSLGVRWDLVKNGAVTFQFDRIHLGAGSAGSLVNLQPGFQRGGKLDLVTANFSFVY
jgi:hypothetical protein